MYTHSHQNRRWLHFGDDGCSVICFEYGPLRNLSAFVKCNGETGITFNLCSLYFSIYLNRFRGFFDRYEAYNLGVRIFDWAIWVDLWAYDHEHDYQVSFWHPNRRRFHWHPLDTLFGSKKHSEQIMNEHSSVEVVMPERIYRASVQMIHWKKKRPRWPFPRRGHWIKIDMHEGDAIPFPGKGESAWDCGDDATLGFTCNETTIEKAIDSLVESVEKRRVKYGGKNWRPTLTVEEKLSEDLRTQA